MYRTKARGEKDKILRVAFKRRNQRISLIHERFSLLSKFATICMYHSPFDLSAHCAFFNMRLLLLCMFPLDSLLPNDSRSLNYILLTFETPPGVPLPPGTLLQPLQAVVSAFLMSSSHNTQ